MLPGRSEVGSPLRDTRIRLDHSPGPCQGQFSCKRMTSKGDERAIEEFCILVDDFDFSQQCAEA